VSTRRARPPFAAAELACTLACACIACASTAHAPADAGAATDAGRDAAPPDAAAPDAAAGERGAGCLTLTFAIDAVPLGGEVWTLAAGDLDGDGNLDVIAVGGGNVAGATFLRGDGHGHLTAAGVVTGVVPGMLPVLADVDGDGRLDVVTPELPPQTAGAPAGVDVFLNAGHASFGPAVRSLSATTISAVALARIDGDAHPDLVFTDAGTDTHLYVAPGRGDGTFGAATDLGPVGGSPLLGSLPPFVGLTALDVDGDGRDDVVAGMGAYGTGGGGGPGAGVGVWLNDGTPSMTKGPMIPFASAPRGLYVGDVDGDGRPDVVDQDDQIFVLRGEGSTLGLVPPVARGGGRSPSVGLADVDHDGRDDVAIIGGIDVGIVQIAHATAQASFDASFSFFVGHQPTFVVAGDLDGDGVTDLVAATRDSHDVVILLSRPHPTGASDERSCSLCGGPSEPGSQDSCGALP
jgi:hypothetical protein